MTMFRKCDWSSLEPSVWGRRSGLPLNFSTCLFAYRQGAVEAYSKMRKIQKI